MKNATASLLMMSTMLIGVSANISAASNPAASVALDADTLTLVSSDPVASASNVARSVTPVLNFSTALNRATVAPNRITLHSVAGTQKTSLSVVGEQLKLLPSDTLLPFTHYTIDVAGLRGVNGEVLAAPLSIDFTTRDAAWQTATLVERSSAYATEPQLAVSANGTAFAMWLQHNGTNFSTWASRYLPNLGWGQPVALESAHDFDSFDPVIAADRSGNALALWDRYDGTHWSIYANRYVAGAGWSGAQVITNSVASSGTIPEVAFDNDGNAIAVWTQYADDGTQNVIADRYVIGNGWGTPEVINGGALTTNQFGPKIDFDAQGNAIAIWQANQNGVTLLWSNRYVAASGWGNAQIVQSDPSSNAFSAQLAVSDNGSAFAVWEQADSAYVSRYVVNSGWQNSIALNTTTNGYGPQVAVNATGEALAVWAQVVVIDTTTQFPSTRGVIWGRRYADGAWQAPTLLQSPNGFTADSPQVVIDASGNGMAAWDQFNGSVYRIYTTRYRADAGWSPRQLIDTPDTKGSFTPQLDIDASGNVFAIWPQNDNTGVQNIWINRFQ
jgi:hypothetical protein